MNSFIILSLLAILSVAQPLSEDAQGFLSIQQQPYQATVANLNDYYVALGQHFSVNTSNFSSCYNLVSATAFFQLQATTLKLEQAVLQGNRN
mmetsp:Transcript_11845/g.10238  ORF Transcript_11845/g.10238 Transcript_11845/m.10238 type:complete len:92 (+) Transcript_11845:11-286(+)